MVSMDKQFTWVLEKFSSLEEKKCYSPPFSVAGCNWRVLVYPKGKKNKRYLRVYLELADPSSLPQGWSRDVKFSLAVVANGWRKSNIVLGDQCCFSAKTKSWGYDEFMSLTELQAKGERFLRNDKLVILAKLHVLPAIVAPEGSVKSIQHLSSKEGNHASGVSVSKSLGNSSSSQMEQKTENVFKECSDGDDDTSSDEGSDGDTSSDEGSDGDDDTSDEDTDALVSQSLGGSSSQVVQKTENVSKEGSDNNDDTSDQGTDDDGSWEKVVDGDEASSLVASAQVEQRSENVSTEGDDKSKEGSDNDDEGTRDDGSWEEVEVSDDASSPVSDDGGRNHSNVLEDASHSVGNRDIKTAETEVSNGDIDDGTKYVDDDSSHVTNDGARNLSSSHTVENAIETATIQPVKETLDVNGFRVLTSQVESVSHIFKRHPDIALGFRPKNQQIRTAYMNELLTLIKTLCKSPEKLSEEDLSNADDTLGDLIDVGFKLDWLKTKLTDVSEKKKKEQASGAKIQTMEEELQKLKLMLLDLETQLQKEKVETLAARAPLSFDDVVC